MEVPDGPEEIETVARRIDFLERLQEGPLHKPGMVESMDHSRSTVDRAIRTLEEAGFVDRDTDGYVTTVAGRLAAQRYRAFLEEQRAVLSARDLLAALPPDCSIPVEVLSVGTVESIDRPYDLFEALADELRAADHYRAALPRIVDSRHVRLWHARAVREDLDVEVLVPSELLVRLREEFPTVSADLVDAGSFEARRVDAPAFGLVIAGRGDDPIDGDPGATSVLVIAYDGDDVVGIVRTEADEALRWARDRYESLAGDSTAATDRIEPRADPGVDSIVGSARRLPPALRAEGFVSLSESYFDRMDPLPPTTAWRAGVGLPEVRAGYAVGRSPRREGYDSLAEDLHGRLLEGSDLALIGPPGAGKSTVCKRVACRWVDDGTVLYREGDADRAFESAALLEDAVERADGPTLVVVEDAVRSDAVRTLSAMRSLAGRDDVQFLIDARESEWRDPEALRSKARLDAVRRERIDPVRMPGLAPEDAERVVEAIGTVLDEPVDLSPEELRSFLSGDRGEEAMPAAAWLLFDRLSRYVAPLEDDAGAPTSLDEDVDRVRSDLAGIGDVARDVGLLVNVLNAAGLQVTPAYAHAVASDADGHSEVREALDRLEGHVLFPGEETAYGTVHDAWSARYLERAIAASGEAATRDRVQRGLVALLELAGDSDRREAVARAVDGDAAAIDRILAEPTDWADEGVSATFELGLERPSLAPLYEPSEELERVLSTVVSEEVAAQTGSWRGRIFLAAGWHDRADDEFARLADNEEGRALIGGLLGRATVARRRDELSTATEFAEQAAELADECDEPAASARAKFELGNVALRRSEYDAAEEYLEAALETFEELDLTRRAADVLSTLGTLSTRRSDYEQARTHYDQSRSRYRAVGDRRGETSSLIDLGDSAHCTGDYETAREQYLRALESSRELGAPELEADAQKSLGNVAYATGDLGGADEQYRDALSIARDLDDVSLRRQILGNLGNVANRLGDVDDAVEYHRRHLELDREAGDEHGQAAALSSLSLARARLCDYEVAIEHGREALELARSAGARRAEGSALIAVGYATLQNGDVEAARERFEDALDVATEIQRPRIRHQAIEYLALIDCWTGEFDAGIRRLTELPENRPTGQKIRGSVAFERSELDEAQELYAAAHEAFEAMEAALGTVLSACAAASVARRRDDLDRAAELLDGIEEVAREDDASYPLGWVFVERAAIDAARDRPERAADRIDRATDLVEGGPEHVVARVRMERGLVERELGDLEAARDSLSVAAERFERIGAEPFVRRAAGHLATICSELGDEEAAERWSVLERDGTDRDLDPAMEALSAGEEEE